MQSMSCTPVSAGINDMSGGCHHSSFVLLLNCLKERSPYFIFAFLGTLRLEADQLPPTLPPDIAAL
jgi:hypothetical protein